LKNGQPLTRQSFFLSFDDGLREPLDIIAPILKQKGVPATFFVNTATLDNLEMLYRHKASLLVDHVRRIAHDTANSKATAPFSDKGVSKRFYSKVRAEGLAQILFGSSAFLIDEH